MISTFYSYKGGVGRSMALANVADVFARRGLRTAMIDFDLEAPGLERFFLPDPTTVRRNRGLMDLLLAYKQAMSGAPGEGEAEFRRVENFLVPIYNQLPSGGTLDLLPAGQRGDDEQLATYAYHLRTFDWQEFYFEWMGELFFQWLRRELLNRYDAILVDSRTGMTEMGGVCAYQLADHLVMFCAANAQNVQGTRDILRNFQSPRVQALRKDRPLDVVVVPARVQQNSADVERFRTEFERSFTPFTPEPLVRSGRAMWDLMLPYEAAYAFEERVADGGELKEAFARLAETVALLAPEESRLRAFAESGERMRELPEPEYDPTRRFAGYDAFVSYDDNDREAAVWLAKALGNRGLKIFLDLWGVAPGEPLKTALERAIDQSRSFLFLIGGSHAGPRRAWEEQLILERQAMAGNDFRLIPVLLPGASFESMRLSLRERIAVDLRSSIVDEEALDALAAAIRGEAPAPQRTTEEVLKPFKGLAPYQEEDADIFYGRENEVAAAVHQLIERNVVAIVGSSASGKTSLVQAGIIPALRAELPGLKVLVVRPALDPFANLSAAVANLADLDVSELEPLLRHSPASLADLIRRHAAGPVLLVIDQMEEIWLTKSEATRSAFLRAIQWALGACKVILVLRADYLVAAMRLGLEDVFSVRPVNVGPLSRDNLRRVIMGPARLAGLAFEPGLVERIMNDAMDSIAPLPLLQVVLSELWEDRKQGFLTHEDYERTGGLNAALSMSADAVFHSLTPEQQASARSMLLRMIGPEGSRIFMPITGLIPQEQEVLDILVQASLVVIDRRAGLNAAAGLAHAGLARHWYRLAAWVEESREKIKLRSKIEDAAADWESNVRASDYLYRGRVLERAEDLARSDPELLSALAKRFLEISREQDRPRSLWRWFRRRR